MSQSKHINYEPKAGTNISYAAEEAVKLAQKESTTVAFKFNSVSLTVDAQTKPQDVVKDYNKQLDAQDEAYRNSAAGKAAAEQFQKTKGIRPGQDQYTRW